MVGDTNVFGTLNHLFQESSTFHHKLTNVDQVCGKIYTLTVVGTIAGQDKIKPLRFKRVHVQGDTLMGETHWQRVVCGDGVLQRRARLERCDGLLWKH